MDTLIPDVSMLVSHTCTVIELVLVALLSVRGIRLFFAAMSSFSGKTDDRSDL